MLFFVSVYVASQDHWIVLEEEDCVAWSETWIPLEIVFILWSFNDPDTPERRELCPTTRYFFVAKQVNTAVLGFFYHRYRLDYQFLSYGTGFISGCIYSYSSLSACFYNRVWERYVAERGTFNMTEHIQNTDSHHRSFVLLFCLAIGEAGVNSSLASSNTEEQRFEEGASDHDYYAASEFCFWNLMSTNMLQYSTLLPWRGSFAAAVDSPVFCFFFCFGAFVKFWVFCASCFEKND